MRYSLFLGFFFFSPWAFGWGQSGHGRIASWAAQIAPAHPLLQTLRDVNPAAQRSFLNLLEISRHELAYLANIPDTYWRNLGNGQKKEGEALGNSTHYFDLDHLVKSPADFPKEKIPVDYASAKALDKDGLLFKNTGSAPWRAQQFADLAQAAWENYPKLESASEKACFPRDAEWVPHPSMVALTYSALMAHFTGDASMPYHASSDWNGEKTNQRGVHWYFESILVDALNEWTLDYWVAQKAKKFLEAGASMVASPAYFRAVASAQYGDTLKRAEVAGLMLALLSNSYAQIQEVARLDAIYAIATVREAIELPQCADLDSVKRVREELAKTSGAKKESLLNSKLFTTAADKDEACRRDPRTRVNKDGQLSRGELRSVAQWNQELIEDRLAISAALTADIWVRSWLKGHAPLLCTTRQYANRPSFVSPTDPLCFGYAMDDSAQNFGDLGKRFKAQTRETCVKFD